jgi:LysR family hydrogen peroxide-inducible transcriptional activator
VNHSPHPLSLRQLQYAVAVAETLSFRRAAELCRVSQPSLSAQLAQLEAAFGVRLFERDARRVRATAAGEQLVARARVLLQQADALVDAAQRLRDPFSGTLRIGIIPTISPYLLPAIMPTLRARHPRLRVQWIEDRTEPVLQRLDAGSLDAALLALEAEIGDVQSEVIALDPFVLATPPGDPLGQRGGPVSLDELRSSRVLLLDDGHCFRDQALAVCSQAGAEELAFRATSLTTLVQMVAAGAGVTLLPRLALPTEVARAELRVREFADPAPHRTVALVWRKTSPMAEALREIAATVRQGCTRTAARARALGSKRSGAKRRARRS